MRLYCRLARFLRVGLAGEFAAGGKLTGIEAAACKAVTLESGAVALMGAVATGARSAGLDGGKGAACAGTGAGR